MSGMTGAQKLYFICAWVVAGCAVLALILMPIGLRWWGMLAAGSAFQVLYLGTTGCLTLLYLSGFFKSSVAFLIAGICVGIAAILSVIFSIAAGYWGGAWAAGSVFQALALGLFCTLLLLHLSGKLGGD